MLNVLRVRLATPMYEEPVLLQLQTKWMFLDTRTLSHTLMGVTTPCAALGHSEKPFCHLSNWDFHDMFTNPSKHWPMRSPNHYLNDVFQIQRRAQQQNVTNWAVTCGTVTCTICSQILSESVPMRGQTHHLNVFIRNQRHWHRKKTYDKLLGNLRNKDFQRLFANSLRQICPWGTKLGSSTF